MTPRSPRRPIAAVLVAAAALAALTSCADPRQPLYLTVERYLAAVQQRDDETLAYLWAPYRREAAGLPPEEEKRLQAAFSQRVREARRLFESAKESGFLPPDPLGVAMFRALGLGQGATSLPLGAEIAADGASARVRTRIVTNLETLRLESLPDGVRIYLMGYPVGKLEMISVGFDAPEKHRLLESVDVEWTLSRAPEGVRSLAGWLIESLTADPASSVEWKPRRPEE